MEVHIKKNFEILVKVYDNCKYERNSRKIAEIEIEYEDVVSVEVKNMSDKEAYTEGYDEVDDFNEYVIIKFANGATSSFRNSYVDIFRLRRLL